MADMGTYFADDNTNIVHLIDKAGTTEDLPRPYLGMSQLGDECLRKLWYYFRWCEKGMIDGRVNRIFQVGHKAEADMIRDLEAIGVETWDTLDAQAGFSAVQNHCRGHSDGMALNIPGSPKTTHLLEFKTSSDKYFKTTKKKGVQEDKPVHYAQMCLYMYFSKTTRALYMVYNKNTSEYYTERVHANNTFAKELIKKAEDVITCENVDEFPKIGSGTPAFFACKFCNYSQQCHFDAPPVRTCRTCTSANVLDDGEWGCGLQNDKILSTEDQALACPNYNVLDCFD